MGRVRIAHPFFPEALVGQISPLHPRASRAVAVIKDLSSVGGDQDEIMKIQIVAQRDGFGIAPYPMVMRNPMPLDNVVTRIGSRQDGWLSGQGHGRVSGTARLALDALVSHFLEVGHLARVVILEKLLCSDVVDEEEYDVVYACHKKLTIPFTGAG